MFGRYPFPALAALGVAALVGAAGARAGASPLPAPVLAQEADPGEKIMNASCQGCHDLRTIQTQAMDADAWTKTIENMVINGAVIIKITSNTSITSISGVMLMSLIGCAEALRSRRPRHAASSRCACGAAAKTST